MTETISTNFVHFDGKTLTGNIATLSFDLDLSGQEVSSDNEKAPTHRLYGRNPRGRLIEVGGIWKRKNREGEDFLCLTVQTGAGRWYANLGLYHGQNNPNLYAVIPNDYLNDDRRN